MAGEAGKVPRRIRVSLRAFAQVHVEAVSGGRVGTVLRWRRLEFPRQARPQMVAGT